MGNVKTIISKTMPFRKPKKRDTTSSFLSAEELFSFSSVTIKLYDGQKIQITDTSQQPPDTQREECDERDSVDKQENDRPTGESTCEQVIRYICQHLLEVKPLMVDLFGIAVQYGNTYLWKSANEKLLPSTRKDLVFRLRYLPSRKKCDVLRKLDENCLKYLFLQVKNDFVNGRVSSWCDQKKELDGKEARGAGVLDMLIAFRMHLERFPESRETTVEEFFKTKIELQAYLPATLLKNSNTALVEKLFDRKNLRNSMKEALFKMHAEHKHGLTKSTELMLSYINYQLDKTLYADMFHKETYEAHW